MGVTRGAAVCRVGVELGKHVETILTAGMIMTACDAGIRKLDIVGPQDTAQNLATLRGSVYRCVQL
jgi:hypothetical protein